MKAYEVRKSIASDPGLMLSVAGIYASDKLPHFVHHSLPYGFVANTDTWGNPGKHWVAFYMDENGQGEFFDSLGRPPQHYCEQFKSFLTTRCAKIVYNTRPLQSPDSVLCGQYCLYYLANRCRGATMQDILSHFTDNTNVNDMIVDLYVKQM